MEVENNDLIYNSDEDLFDNCECEECDLARYHRNQIKEITPINVFNSEIENEIDICSICLVDMNEKSETFLLDCNHRFHTKCIIDVFRKTYSYENNGKCPLCRKDPDHNIVRSYNSKYELLQIYMKDNKDKCHPYLLRLYKDIYNCDEKIKKNEINEKEFKKEIKEFCIVNEDIIKQKDSLTTELARWRIEKRRCGKILQEHVNSEISKIKEKINEIELNNKDVFEFLKKKDKKSYSFINKRNLEIKKKKSLLFKLNDIPIQPLYVQIKVGKKANNKI
jgi:hypothetical protein